MPTKKETTISPPTLRNLKGVLEELRITPSQSQHYSKEELIEKATAIYDRWKDELKVTKYSDAAMAAVLLKALGRGREAEELFDGVLSRVYSGGDVDRTNITDIRIASLIIRGDLSRSRHWFDLCVNEIENKMDIGNPDLSDFISLEALLRGETIIAIKAHRPFRQTEKSHTIYGIVAHYLEDTKGVEECISTLEGSRKYHLKKEGVDQYSNSFPPEINTGIFFTVLAGVDLRSLIPRG
jgi:hypothetical protein